MKDVEKEYSSVKERYFFKLGSNLVGLLFNIGLQAIVPRGLGPRSYGDYNFLVNSFNQITNFFDLGTSGAYYTKLSQRPEDHGLVTFYWYFSVFVCISLLVLVGFASYGSINDELWPGQAIIYVYLAAIWGILTWFAQVVGYMADAYGLTVKTEKLRMLQKIFNLILIFGLFVVNKLDLVNYFLCNFVILLFLIVSFALVIRRSRFSILGPRVLDKEKIKEYAGEFYEYCSPLVVFALVSLFVNYLDRWLLQVFAGSVEQGYFGLSYQIGAVCFLFTGAMTPLIRRELSIAHANNDIDLMTHYFRRYVPLFYSIAAYFASFVAVQAPVVVQLMGGEAYEDAIAAVMIMAIYPVHQTYGQLSGAVFLASGQTGLYRNIGIFSTVSGLALTYVLLAPVQYWGFDLGAAGLSVKMVLIQLVGVNIQLYYNAKFLNLTLHRYVLHQILSLGGMLAAAIGTSWVAAYLLGSLFNQYIVFFISGFVYSMIVLAAVYKFPKLFGLSPGAIGAMLEVVYNRIHP